MKTALGWVCYHLVMQWPGAWPDYRLPLWRRVLAQAGAYAHQRESERAA